MPTISRRAAKIIAATAAIPASLLFAGATAAVASPARTSASASSHALRQPPAQRYRVRQILNGMKLRHTFIPVGSAKPRSEPLADPDDITVLGRHLTPLSRTGSARRDRPAPTGTPTARS